LGGGAQEDGQLYRPAGTVDNFGIGSHGAASGTVYRGNLIGNVARGINLRGRDETIEANKFFGDFATCVIDLSHGANTAIIGNEYNNGFNEGDQTAQVEANSFAAINIFNYQASSFVRVQSNYEFGYTSIRNNIVRGVNRYFLYFDFSTAVTLPGFEITNNYVYIVPNAAINECALVGTLSGSKNFVFAAVNNNIVTGRDSTDTLATFGANVSINALGAGVNEFSGLRTLTVWMSNQTTAKMRVPYNNATYIVFMLYCGNSTTQRFFGMLPLNSTSLTTMGSSNNMQAFTTPPTGTSPTAGNIGVNYDGSFFNLANNAGGSRTVHVTFFPIQ